MMRTHTWKKLGVIAGVLAFIVIVIGMIAPRCPGPPNLCVCLPYHSLMKLLPLLYAWMENSQEFVFRHSRCLPNLNRHEFLFPRAGRGA